MTPDVHLSSPALSDVSHKLQPAIMRRLQALLKEVTDAAGQIILFIDEIHLVLGEWRCCIDS